MKFIPPTREHVVQIDTLVEARKGHAPSQLKVGILELTGKGGFHTSDHAYAAVWILKAAEQKLPEAQYVAALLYSAGSGVTQDQGMAAKSLKASADHGYAPAVLLLQSKQQPETHRTIFSLSGAGTQKNGETKFSAGELDRHLCQTDDSSPYLILNRHMKPVQIPPLRPGVVG